jgi:hypothetical protein
MSTAGSPMDMDMSYGGSFASANFSDDNAAGSGLTTSRAIFNLCTVHMNDVSWKSSIPLLFDKYESDLVQARSQLWFELSTRISSATYQRNSCGH